MNKYLLTILSFVGVWFIASILNGLLSSIFILIFNSNSCDGLNGTMGLAFLFSFLLSIPFVGMVWFVTTLAQLSGQKGFSLFQVVLTATLLCALAAALFFINMLGFEFKEARLAGGLSIIISALCSVLLFRKQFKTNG